MSIDNKFMLDCFKKIEMLKLYEKKILDTQSYEILQLSLNIISDLLEEKLCVNLYKDEILKAYNLCKKHKINYGKDSESYIQDCLKKLEECLTSNQDDCK